MARPDWRAWVDDSGDSCFAFGAADGSPPRRAIRASCLAAGVATFQGKIKAPGAHLASHVSTMWLQLHVVHSGGPILMLCRGRCDRRTAARWVFFSRPRKRVGLSSRHWRSPICGTRQVGDLGCTPMGLRQEAADHRNLTATRAGRPRDADSAGIPRHPRSGNGDAGTLSRSCTYSLVVPIGEDLLGDTAGMKASLVAHAAAQAFGLPMSGVASGHSRPDRRSARWGADPLRSADYFLPGRSRHLQAQLVILRENGQNYSRRLGPVCCPRPGALGGLESGEPFV